MVCVPCFIIPLLLYIWHKFVQPILLRYWNPWAKKDAEGNVINKAPDFPFECKGGVCPFVPGAKKTPTSASDADATDAKECKESSVSENPYVTEAAAEAKKDI
ncbi:UPF0729 protein GD16342 [Drosophila yakuba]|uniref:Uncharacterized protein, isoform A n=1 Tax=Drosophila yakuba TaxID=7245 RepID=B4Q0L6_DROYA|nr:UPF0729 protein GD16342 [Drosophila yakuba]XP_015045624.1 UPF0729 protein GD16342 [Drosophila yakuba]EDX01300.1 uncharacterized protein Dyak_GE16906, isoform A [Drosophila yakuba]KRK06064.1 uncharacterized protein Dyak_GE16906, isoform B [Drosophila yakuba]